MAALILVCLRGPRSILRIEGARPLWGANFVDYVIEDKEAMDGVNDYDTMDKIFTFDSGHHILHID